MIRNSIVSFLLLFAIAAFCQGQSATIAGASTASDRNTPPDVKVTIDNFSFAPQTLTIPAGTRVIWINRDDIPHTVVNDDLVFRSKALDTDESFSFTFTKPGMYPYFCSIHPKMTGKIIVK